MFHPRQDTSCRGSLGERRAPRGECHWAAGQLLGLSDVVAESEPGAWRAEGGLEVMAALTLATLLWP